MKKIVRTLAAGTATVFLSTLFSASAAFAGSFNNAIVFQQSPVGTLNGNTLSIDQSAASSSDVQGVGMGKLNAPHDTNGTLLDLLPISTISANGYAVDIASVDDSPSLRQIGEGNSAELTLSGAGGALELYQFSTPTAGTPGNQATLTATSGALGGVIQIGTLNQATLDVGTNGTGLITQLGTNLNASLTVNGGGSGAVTQIGSGSSVNVQVAGNSTLDYTQIGNNLSTATGVSLYSTQAGQTVTVVQTSNPASENVNIIQNSP